MIRDRRFAIIFRGVGFLITLAGLMFHLGVSVGKFMPGALMYYTIQSNILVLVLFGMLLFTTIKGLKTEGKYGKTGYFARFEMVCVVDIMLTMLVYWILLVPNAFNMGGFDTFSFENVTAHLVVPLFCLFDYFLFAEPKHLKYRDVYYILIYPLSYVAFSTIAGFSGYVYRTSAVDDSVVRFPYFFFDYDQVGWAALLYIAAIAVIFLLISHAFYLLDKKWKKPLLFTE